MDIEIINETDFDQYNKALLQQIAANLTDKTIELLIIDSQTMQKLNAQHRNVDKPTDVLSFPLAAVPNAPLGTVVINKDSVIEAASTYGHSQEEEFTLLFIHGLLHLLGYDHEVDNGQMRQLEEKLIKEYHLPKSLIVRTESKE